MGKRGLGSYGEVKGKWGEWRGIGVGEEVKA